jgi:LmbE family N-acetylglucosaminyl deacetylase
MRKILSLLLFLVISTAIAQPPQKLNSAEIQQAIKKLNFLGSVLYVGAHPDDENTRLISYLSNEVHARTGYLSMTRGDGGQNLLGPELKELLGVIRTQELLAARRIDGGEQFFTRAIDFGYTKTPEETLEIWNKKEVLSDVVWVFRTFKPDVIINRFNHRTSGDTHGQHTASALLSVEAFDLAKDPSAFPGQLKYTQTFEPKRLFFNTSPWFYESNEAFKNADKSNFLEFNTGVYFPSKGLSNPEISALSRSRHQSQGFGSTGSRGTQTEYLELIDGKLPENPSGLFDGIDTSWNRLKGGAEIGQILAQVETNYDFEDPSASLPKLVEAYMLIQALEDSYWKQVKTEEIKNIISASSGLYLEAISETPTAIASQEIQLNIEAINRSKQEMTLTSINLNPGKAEIEPNIKLQNNQDWKKTLTFKVPDTANYTTPYWLKQDGTLGMYKVEDQQLIGLPQNPRKINVRFSIRINEVEIPFDKTVVYKYNDPVKGEVYQPFEVIPLVSVKIQDKVLIFANSKSKIVPVTIMAKKNELSGQLSLQTTENWKIDPKTANFNLKEKGASITINFTITPPKDQEEAILKPIVKVDGTNYSDEIVTIDYSHIPLQTLVLPSKTKLVKLNIKRKGENIGYIEGAGDVVPESLEQIGFAVTKIDPGSISASSLANFDAIVLGIRAYNTVEELKYKQPALLKYVENGGTLIAQYNVTRGIIVDKFAPFSIELSHERVTEENAEVRFLTPDHPVLNSPNKITAKDFENWVQERGLYFANKWAPEFTPILSMNDKNETPKNGSLLIAKYGKGYFIYTGLSFFRQFPEGVPGAFRLFSNLVSIGK